MQPQMYAVQPRQQRERGRRAKSDSASDGALYRSAVSARHRDRRSGLAAMELALVLPILLLLILGLLEFSLLFYARGSIVEASRAGARAATRMGIDFSQIQNEVGLVLSPTLCNGLQVGVEGGESSGDAVTVAVRVPMNSACPDLLWPIGYSLQGRYLYAEATMIKE